MKKGEIYEGIIEKIEYPNKGLVYLEDTKITVKNGIPGQKVRFLIHKKRAGRLEGRILEVLETSPLEQNPPACQSFPACGGCMYQTMPYQEQLAMKSTQVQELLARVLPSGFPYEGILPSPQPFAYRNKMEFSFGDEYKDGPLSLGLHKKGSTYDVLNTDDCKLVHEDMTKILVCVRSFFSERGMNYYKKMQHTGYLRHLLLRRGDQSREILVNLVTTSQETIDLSPLVHQLTSLQLTGKIVGILHIINDSLSDVVQSDETRILYGRDYFYEQLLGLEFRVTPFSFFQPNSQAAEVLYQVVRDYIGNTRDRTVYDLYSGTGTIAQLLAPVAREVIGVEIVPEAVEAARENARRNGLTNCKFLAGDVLTVIDEIEEKPDIIVLDPPRDGIHPKAIGKIIAFGVQQIVYVSCKPTSLVRDLEVFLAHGYAVERCVAVDQFAETVHVETVVLLSRAEK
ncbi:MAG: 23S rRNA (uracil(1939)-C(5))-methyltransferase RlmD [Lachnospiraceae bacterium]